MGTKRPRRQRPSDDPEFILDPAPADPAECAMYFAAAVGDYAAQVRALRSGGIKQLSAFGDVRASKLAARLQAITVEMRELMIAADAAYAAGRSEPLWVTRTGNGSYFCDTASYAEDLGPTPGDAGAAAQADNVACAAAEAPRRVRHRS